MTGRHIRTSSPPPNSPIRARIGVVGPLNLIDTTPYEFYRVAPEGAIFVAIGLGLAGLDAGSARAAFSGLEDALGELRSRDVDIVMLNGLPMLAHLDDDDIEEFRIAAAAFARLGGRTALDACHAAIATLGVRRIVVASKWSEETNQKLSDKLAESGVEVVGQIGRSQNLDEIKGDYETGSRAAWELAHQAKHAYGGAEAILLAGSAWLTLHLVADLEESLGMPVLTGLQCTNWYALNLTSVFQPRSGQGRLLATQMTGAGDQGR